MVFSAWEPQPQEKPAHRPEPLCHQEERGREHAGRGPPRVQRHAAESGAGAGAVLSSLHHPRHPHQRLSAPAGGHRHPPRGHCSTELNEVEKQWRLNQLNNAATALVSIIVVINIFITAFGAHKPGFLAARTSRSPL